MKHFTHTSLGLGFALMGLLILTSMPSDQPLDAACSGPACQTGVYIRVHGSQLETVLDNLETATTEQQQRIKGFQVMFNHQDPIDNPTEVAEGLATIQTQMARARTMGYEAFPGYILAIGRGAPDYNNNGDVSAEEMYESYFDANEWQERVDTIIKPLFAMNAPGDKRFVIDTEAYIIRIKQGNAQYPTFAKKKGHTEPYNNANEFNRYLVGTKPLTDWMRANNVHVITHPAGIANAMLLSWQMTQPVTHQTEGSFFMANLFTDNPTAYQSNKNDIAEHCFIVEELFSNAGCQPVFIAEALRDRAAAFRADIAAFGINTYWIFPFDKLAEQYNDGPISEMFTKEWFEEL